MPDMLVKLYDLPDLAPVLAAQREVGIDIRRALAPEKGLVTSWVRDHFSPGYASECEVAFSNRPITCFIATCDHTVVGFAVHETTCKDFFGPTGVLDTMRGRGIGAALLLACLHDMRAQGYGYAIIGWAGPTDFYTKICGATVIPNSEPGVYRGILKTT